MFAIVMIENKGFALRVLPLPSPSPLSPVVFAVVRRECVLAMIDFRPVKRRVRRGC